LARVSATQDIAEFTFSTAPPPFVFRVGANARIISGVPQKECAQILRYVL
jgi:hypothetical protein